MGMMINRRRVCGGKKGLLPSGYVQLEYIESTGTQCIDTGLAGNITGNRYKIGFTRTRINGTAANGIIGAHNSSQPYNRSYIAVYMSQWEFGYGATVRWGTVTNNTYYDIELDTTNSKYLCKINGGVIQDVAISGDRATANILIGVVYQIGSTYSSIGKFHYAEIYDTDGTTLLMNLIPCKRKSDNVVGMYDTVGGNFLTNAGTGDFIAGPEI